MAFEHAPVTSAFDGGDVESAVAQSIALQRRMGVTAVQPLPRAHAEALAQRLVENPIEELPALLGNLRRVGERNLPALLAQLTRVGLPTSLALAGALGGQAQRLLLEAHGASAGAALSGAASSVAAGGGAAPGRPDGETVEQARAGLAETRPGRLLFGALDHDRKALDGAASALGAPADRSARPADAPIPLAESVPEMDGLDFDRL